MLIDINCRENILTPLFIGGENCESGYFYGPAVREYYILHFVISGCGEYRAGGNVYKINAGEAFLIRPNEVTFYKADENHPWSYIWAAWESSLEVFGQLPLKIESRELKGFMHSYPTVEAIAELNELRTAALIWSVAACISEAKYQKKRSTDYISRAIGIMEQHYSESLSVADIAEALSIDRSYFSNLFKKEVGISPSRYITELRMQKASELLERNLYSVAVVAASVGFSDQFTFSRCFKKHYGISPSSYKKGSAE